MEKYREYVNDLAQKRVNNTFFNSDEAHALEVFINLFQIAKGEIRIFAGNLCSYVANKPKYIEKISDFIEKNGIVKILLNDYDKEKSIDSNLFLRLALYKSLGKNIHIKTTSIKPYYTSDPDKKEIHFTVVDNNAYRIETDINDRTASCNFNNDIEGNSLVVFFDSIFNDEASLDIDLLSLFNLNENGDK